MRDDTAAAVEFFLSGNASWITGQVLSVDGGAGMREPTVRADPVPTVPQRTASGTSPMWSPS